MSHSKYIVDIANKLFEYSNVYVEIRSDPMMPIPGFSLIEQDIHGLFRPVAILNPKILTEDPSVIAHIMSHEWGHHVMRHISKIPPLPNAEKPHDRQMKEDEADTYAARFIKSHNYDTDAIEAFMREHPFDLENRLRILRETASDNVEARSDEYNSSIGIE